MTTLTSWMLLCKWKTSRNVCSNASDWILFAAKCNGYNTSWSYYKFSQNCLTASMNNIHYKSSFTMDSYSHTANMKQVQTFRHLSIQLSAVIKSVAATCLSYATTFANSLAFYRYYFHTSQSKFTCLSSLPLGKHGNSLISHIHLWLVFHLSLPNLWTWVKWCQLLERGYIFYQVYSLTWGSTRDKSRSS